MIMETTILTSRRRASYIQTRHPTLPLHSKSSDVDEDERLRLQTMRTMSQNRSLRVGARGQKKPSAREPARAIGAKVACINAEFFD